MTRVRYDDLFSFSFGYASFDYHWFVCLFPCLRLSIRVSSPSLAHFESPYVRVLRKPTWETRTESSDSVREGANNGRGRIAPVRIESNSRVVA